MINEISAAQPQQAQERQGLRIAARQLEASFLAEMLKQAGVGRPLSAFGGGAGEEAFASFVVQSYAERMVEAGGIGLSQHIYEALTKLDKS